MLGSAWLARLARHRSPHISSPPPPPAGFLPSIGRLLRYREPSGPGVRCDSGVQEGSEISMHYDPLISKLCTHAVDRPSTLAAMRAALDSYVIRGVQHNTPLLRSVLDVPSFQAGTISTAFLAGQMRLGGKALASAVCPGLEPRSTTLFPRPSSPRAENYPTPQASAPDRLPLSAAQEDQLLAAAAMLWAARERRLSGGGELRGELELVLTLGERQVPATVRPAAPGLAPAPGPGEGQALEVQLPHRILVVRDTGGSTAQLVNARVRALVWGQAAAGLL